LKIRDCSRPLAEVFDFTALALGVSPVSAFSLKQAIANSRKTEQHSLQSAPQAGREQSRKFGIRKLKLAIDWSLRVYD